MDKRTSEIRRMHRDGMTYEQIGNKLGITRQRAHQLANRKEPTLFRSGAVKKIPFAGLRRWMTENECSTAELSRRCGVRRLDLSGKRRLRVDVANRILAVTGLAFDDCFGRAEDGK